MKNALKFKLTQPGSFVCPCPALILQRCCPFSYLQCDLIFLRLQFQEQLGQGCSPEEADTFQAQGWCQTTLFLAFLQLHNSCWSHILLLLFFQRFGDTWPDAAVPWTSTKAYATAGGIQCGIHRCTNKNSDRPFLIQICCVCVSAQDYLDMMGLSVMFPRVEVFLIQGSPVDMLERPQMDGRRSSCRSQSFNPDAFHYPWNLNNVETL